MLQIIQTHEEQVITAPEGGYEAKTEAMTPEEVQAFKENTKGSWHDSAAFLVVMSLIVGGLYVFEVEVALNVALILGVFILAVIVLTTLEKIHIWQDLRNPTKEIITGLVKSKREHRNASNSNGAATYSYFLQFPDGEELSVTADVYQNINAGDIFRIVRSQHSRRTFHEYVQKGASAVGSFSTHQAAQNSSQSISDTLTTPMPMPLGMSEQAALRKLYHYFLNKRRWSIAPEWLFTGFVLFIFYAIGLSVLGSEGVAMTAEFVGLCLLMYWVILLWLLHRKISKGMTLLRQDLLLGYQLQRTIVFKDKITQNIVPKGSLFVPSSEGRKSNQRLLLVASDQKKYHLEAQALFEIIQVNEPYTLFYLPHSEHWLYLKSTDKQQTVLYQYA